MQNVITPEQLKQATLRIDREDFILLRNSRDVIKSGPVRNWDAGPDQTCPVQEMFYRSAGIRIVGPSKDLATHEQ
jgi:hypothetical protein